MYNLLISYDLKDPGKDYDRLIKAIKALGSWAKIHYSLWYVTTQWDSSKIYSHLRAMMDGNDDLFVINVTNTYAAVDPQWSDKNGLAMPVNWVTPVRVKA